jgi:hypothetical protein
MGVADAVVLAAIVAGYSAAALPALLHEHGIESATRTLEDEERRFSAHDLLARAAASCRRTILVSPDVDRLTIRIVRQDVPLDSALVRRILGRHGVVFDERVSDGREYVVAGIPRPCLTVFGMSSFDEHPCDESDRVTAVVRRRSGAGVGAVDVIDGHPQEVAEWLARIETR